MSDPGRPGLVRAIGRGDLTLAIVNGVIGSAIFRMPSQVAGLTGAWSPLAYALAGAGVLLMVLCFAEVASRYRDAGGPYLYARDAFGEFAGFQAGWLTFFIRITALAANLNVFVLYLGELAPLVREGAARAAVILALCAVLAAINLAGVRQATWAVDAFTIAKLLPLALLVVFGLPRVDAAALGAQPLPALAVHVAWTDAVLLLVFAYGGFEAPLIPAGEARDPRRDTAFALLAALGLIALVYMAVQFVVVGLVPGVAQVGAPVAAAFSVLFGPAGVMLAAVAAMVSIWGYSTGSVLQAPRLLFAMAERGDLPARLAAVSPTRHTPDAAILLFTALVALFALHGDFEWNATLSAIVRLLTYGLTCAAVLRLRRLRPDEAPGFRLPAAGLVAPAGVAFCAYLLATRSYAQAGATLLLFGLGALAWWAGRSRRAAA